MTLANPFSAFIAMPAGAVVVALSLVFLLLMMKKHESAFWAGLRQLFPTPRSSRWQIALTLAIAVGIALVVLMPEANIVFTAVDAAGLDLVTLFIALELRQYIAVAYQLALAPILRIIYRLGPVPIFEPYADLMRGCPSLRSYVVIWPLFVIALSSTCLGGLVIEVARYSLRRV
jgi:hypothetical protein